MNRAEKRALKFNHQPSGKVFTTKGVGTGKTSGKIKKQGRVVIPRTTDSSTHSWNIPETS